MRHAHAGQAAHWRGALGPEALGGAGPLPRGLALTPRGQSSGRDRGKGARGVQEARGPYRGREHLERLPFLVVGEPSQGLPFLLILVFQPLKQSHLVTE